MKKSAVICFKGHILTAYELCKRHDVAWGTACGRVQKGWSVIDACTTPVKTRPISEVGMLFKRYRKSVPEIVSATIAQERQACAAMLMPSGDPDSWTDADRVRAECARMILERGVTKS